MRKLLVLLTVIALAGGAASAQGYWAGASIGTGGAFHFGVEDITPGLDLRANLGYNYLFGVGLNFGVDALYGLPIDLGDVPLDPYAGGGLVLGAYNAGFSFGIEAFGGVEYRLSDLDFPAGGVFFELGPVIRFTPTFNAGAVGRLGFNYHF